MSVAGGPRIYDNGLILSLDAANPKSFSGVGSIWYDLSGNDYHARGQTDSGTGYDDANVPLWDQRDGGAFSWPSSDRASKGFTIESDMGTHSAITHEIWCWRITSGGADYLSDARNGSGSWHLTNYLSYNINIHAALQANDPTTYSSTSNWWDKWICIVWTSDSSGSQLFIDGEKVVSPYLVLSNSCDEDIGTDFHIGCRYTGSGNWFGWMAVYRIWSRVLSDLDIKRNYDALKGRFGL